MIEIVIRRETSGEAQIRVGQGWQQTVEVCPYKRGTHLAVCHTAALCHPLWPLTHPFYPVAENRQFSGICINDVDNCIVKSGFL